MGRSGIDRLVLLTKCKQIQLNVREERAKDDQKKLLSTRKRKKELADEISRLRRLIDENHL